MTVPGALRALRTVPAPCLALCLVIGTGCWMSGCGDTAPAVSYQPLSAAERATRRAYAGAPPVIPHPRQSGRCTNCHGAAAREVPTVGLAPANPHQQTAGLSSDSRCRQCHVFRQATDEFQPTNFVGLTAPPVLPPHNRSRPHAAPRIPHPVFMREDCRACHTGLAARPELRCTHAERSSCTKCHVPLLARLDAPAPPAEPAVPENDARESGE